MATKLEISTVAAVKSVQTLRQQTAALTGVLKELTRTISTLQSKMKGGGGARELAASHKKAASDGRLLSKELLKQKNAAASSAIQFKSLAQALKLAGAENVRLSNLRRSVEALDKKLKAGRLTPRQYAAAINRWKASMATARRELIRLKDAEQKHTAAARLARVATRRLTPAIRRLGTRSTRSGQKVSGLSKRLKILGSSAIFAVGPLSGVGARIAAFGAITSKAGVRIALAAVGIAAFLVGVIKLAKAMLSVNVEMTKIMNALKVATGGAESARFEFEFLVKTSKELSLNLPAVSLQFAQLSAAAAGTTLASGGVRDIFVSMSKAALVLSLSAEQTQGAFRALQQMISKGTVQAEELRGQLGERLPGAFQIAARAMGVTTRELGKLMEQGLIRATELIPKMSEELDKMFDPSILDAMNSWTAATNRLSTAWFLFLDELDRKVQSSEALRFFVIGMTMAIEDALSTLSGKTAFDEEMKKVELAIKRVTASLKPLEIGFATALKFTTAQKGRLFVLRGELEGLKKLRDELNRTDTSGAIQTVNQPPLTNQAFLDLPVTSVNRLQDSFSSLTKIMKVLSDESVDLEKRLDMRDALNRTMVAAKAVNKIMRSLSDNEEFALRLQFTPAGKGVLTLKQLREVLLKLVIDEKDLQNATKDATQALRQQARAADRLSLNFAGLKLKLETVTDAMEQAFSGGFVSTQFVNSLNAARKMLLKFSDEAIALSALSNKLISQQSFDNFISSEGLARAEAFARILAVVEQEFGAVLRATDDAKQMARVFAETKTEAELFLNELERLEHLLVIYGEFPDKVEAIKRKMAEINPVLQTISDGFKQFGSDLAGAIREGKSLVDVLINSFGNLIERLLDLAIQLLIIKPLLAGLGLPGGDANIGAAVLGSLGIPTNILGVAKGGAFSAGRQITFAKGGILDSPTAFGLSGGKTGIAGEAGIEAVLPLKRDSSGTLGVEASGAAAPVVNFFLAPGTNLREFNEAQPQVAAMIAGTMAAASASNG